MMAQVGNENILEEKVRSTVSEFRTNEILHLVVPDMRSRYSELGIYIYESASALNSIIGENSRYSSSEREMIHDYFEILFNAAGKPYNNNFLKKAILFTEVNHHLLDNKTVSDLYSLSAVLRKNGKGGEKLSEAKRDILPSAFWNSSLVNSIADSFSDCTTEGGDVIALPNINEVYYDFIRRRFPSGADYALHVSGKTGAIVDFYEAVNSSIHDSYSFFNVLASSFSRKDDRVKLAFAFTELISHLNDLNAQVQRDYVPIEAAKIFH
jgi:hypothetical protein